MTEPTPVPDEPGEGLRTPRAPSNGAHVDGVPAYGWRATVALGQRPRKMAGRLRARASGAGDASPLDEASGSPLAERMSADEWRGLMPV